MFKFITKAVLALALIGFLAPIEPTNKQKTKDDNSALQKPLLVSATLGAGAGLYALWHTVAYTDLAADKLAQDLPLCRWREQSLWPLRHTWWSVDDMKKDRKHAVQCLAKDLDNGALTDRKGKHITMLQDLSAAIQHELDQLYETKTAYTINSACGYVASWFGAAHNQQQSQETADSIDRLINRLIFMQMITQQLPVKKI